MKSICGFRGGCGNCWLRAWPGQLRSPSPSNPKKEKQDKQTSGSTYWGGTLCLPFELCERPCGLEQQKRRHAATHAVYFSSSLSKDEFTSRILDSSTPRRLTCPAFGPLSHRLGRACAGASLYKAPRRRDAGSPKRLPLSASPRTPPLSPPMAQKAK